MRMNTSILVVDDEYLALEGTMDIIKRILPDADVRGFRDADEAVCAVRSEPSAVPDIAFLDIETRSVSGIEIALMLKEANPSVNIIFVTGFGDYMKDAFSLHASGYIMKPVSENKVRKELLNLRFPLPGAPVKIRAFGNFEVFVNSRPLMFTYTKTKELLAVLVDAHGSLLSVNAIINTLWDDDFCEAHKSYFRNLVSDLRRAFCDNRLDGVIVNRRGYMGLDCTKVSCDYFDFLDGKEEAVDAFGFEYMSQYSWAESTLGTLVARAKKRKPQS